jgi:hypothetical protein
MSEDAQPGTAIPYVATHDIRLTFVQLAQEGDSSIERIRVVLGHDPVKTAQDYLGAKQNFVNASAIYLVST